jgi:hypothetical protein
MVSILTMLILSYNGEIVLSYEDDKKCYNNKNYLMKINILKLNLF